MSDELNRVLNNDYDHPPESRCYVNFSEDTATSYQTGKIQQQQQQQQQQTMYRSNRKISPIRCTRSSNRSNVKTAYFYQDGDLNGQTIRLAIHPNRYRSLEALLGDLTEKMPKLPSGARAIFTPRGKDKVCSLADLQNNGHYICSERTVHPRGIQFDRTLPPWRSGTQEYSRTIRKTSHSPKRFRMEPEGNVKGNDPSLTSPPLKKTESPEFMEFGRSRKSRLTLPMIERINGIHGDQMPPTYTGTTTTTATTTTSLNESKQIRVRLDSGKQMRRTVLLRRRHVHSMKQVLHELSELFGVPVQRVYTIDGKAISTVEDLINGPEEIVATGSERLVSRPLQNAISSPHLNISDHHSNESKERCEEIWSRSRKLDQSVPRQLAIPSYVSRNRSLNRTSGITGTWKVLISSAKAHPQTGEPYLTACTSSVVLTICSQHHTCQSIALRSVYVRSMPDSGRDERSERLNSPNGVYKDRQPEIPFRPGRTDQFEIILSNITDIYKIRLSHDGSGNYPEWLPGEVRMRLLNIEKFGTSVLPRITTDVNRYTRLGSHMFPGSLGSTNMELRFPVMQWLSRTKADESLVREVAAPGTQSRDFRPLGKPMLRSEPMNAVVLQGERAPVIRYQLRVITGNLWNAGTEANVKVVLQGERGDTGIRTLWDPETGNRFAFTRGKTSNFNIEAVSLGRLRRLSIWLDASCVEERDEDVSQWYLDKILVRELRPVYLPGGDTAVAVNECVPAGSETPNISGRGWSCFPCYQWLGIGTQPGSRRVQLIASAGSGNLSSELIESTSLINQEDMWWQTEKWKFIPGMQLVFYSYVTGAPLQVIDAKDGRVTAQNNSKRTRRGSTPTIFQVFSASKGSKRVLKPRLPTKSLGMATGLHGPVAYSLLLHQDVERYNEQLLQSNVHTFQTVGPLKFQLCLNDIAGLHVTEKNTMSYRSANETTEFRVRPQHDHWIVLEAVRTSAERVPTHVYVGPEGHVVSGASGPLSVPGKLFMVHVKGVLRDQAVIWLCTSVSQTLAPQIRPHNVQPMESVGHGTGTSWAFELRATGPRSPEAYWRVVKLGKQIRLFEALAWPGHYLRVTNGEVNILGAGGIDCQFRITRNRAQGFIRLSPMSETSKYLGMEDDGQVRLFSDQVDESTRFYPELVKVGIQRDLEFFAQKEQESTISSVVNAPVNQINRRSSYPQTDESTLPKDVESLKSGHDLLENSEKNISARSSEIASEKHYTERDWKVSIVTAKEARNCNVILVVYGLQATSGPILIGRSDDVDKQLFRKNSTDGFMITLENLGKIYKIRFELSPLDKQMDMEWELMEVILENCFNNQRLSFDFSGRPFRRNEHSCHYCREQLAEDLFVADQQIAELEWLSDNQEQTDEDLKIIQTELRIGLVNYRVQLELQSESGWSVDRKQFEPHISLIGKYGDCGRRLTPLLEPTSMKPIDTDHCWLFETDIEAVYLGELSRCLLGPVDVNTMDEDAERSGPICTRVLVWDPINQFVYLFRAGTWLLGYRSGQVHEVHLNVSEIRSVETSSSGSEDKEKNDIIQAIREDAHALIAAIVEKAEKNLQEFEQSRYRSESAQ